MENYGIPNGKVRASSEWDSNHAAIQGRLHYKPPRGKQGAWSARHNNINQWLQVDLGSAFIKVTGVATQGRYNYDQWVTKYKLQYSNDGVTFTYYKEPGQTADMVKKNKTFKLIHRVALVSLLLLRIYPPLLTFIFSLFSLNDHHSYP